MDLMTPIVQGNTLIANSSIRNFVIQWDPSITNL